MSGVDGMVTSEKGKRGPVAPDREQGTVVECLRLIKI